MSDEDNSLPRRKILSEEIHVTRIVPCVTLPVTPDIVTPNTFLLHSACSPPVELTDTANMCPAHRKCWWDERRMEQIKFIYAIFVPLSPDRKDRVAFCLETPPLPCQDIHDEVNNVRNIQKDLNECQLEDIFIQHPAFYITDHLPLTFFIHHNILQQPPEEVADKINKAGVKRSSGRQREIFEISLVKPIVVSDSCCLSDALLREPPPSPNIDICDCCNTPSNKVKHLTEVPHQVITILSWEDVYCQLKLCKLLEC